MAKQLSVHERLRENEAVFRRYNETVEGRLDTLQAHADYHEIEHTLDGDQMSFYFYCECSDENCLKRIHLQLSTYKQIHDDRACFVVIPGHEVTEIEEVIERADDYSVVRKYKTPKDVSDTPYDTPVTNS